jgi:IclR family KDG regulon transcriptional repressor
MENYGYVQQENSTRLYRLGKQFYSIGWQLTNQYSLQETARPFINRLAEQTGECSHIAVYSAGKAMVCDDVQPETSLLRVVGQTGRLLHLHNTALGKVLLAFGDHPLPSELPKLTENTITDVDELDEHLVEIRELGYALDDEENEVGVRCLAAPIFNDIGIVIGVIGISGPSIRLLPELIDQFASAVMARGHELSQELGFDGVYPSPLS